MGVGNDSKASDRFSKLNMLIRDVAIRGNIDCLGPIDINWKACGRYVLVLIEEYTGKWWYRVFISNDDFQYERKRILYPADADDLVYVYGYYENMAGSEREVQMLKNGDWPYRVKALAQAELCEERNGELSMQTIMEKWPDVLAYIKEHYDITDVAYKVWLEPLSISELPVDGAITIMVPADPPHAYEYVRRKFGGLLREALWKVTGEELPLNFGIKYYMTVNQ